MTPEGEVLKSVMTYLRWKGVYCWRNQTGAHTAEYNGKQRLIRFGAVGSPDIIGVTPGGRFIGVEVKAGKNTPTEAQRLFLAEIEQRGGIALWCNESNYSDLIDAALEGV